MTTLKQPSMTKVLLATLREVVHHFTYSSRAVRKQYALTKGHLTQQYEACTIPELRAAGITSLEYFLGQLLHPYGQGDIDILQAYVRFSVIENPSLPVAINNLRLATGRNRVLDILTQEHLDLHHKMVQTLIKIGVGANDSIPDKSLDNLAAFIFLNMDRAEDIIRAVEERQIIDPKDIVAILDTKIAAPLREGVL